VPAPAAACLWPTTSGRRWSGWLGPPRRGIERFSCRPPPPAAARRRMCMANNEIGRRGRRHPELGARVAGAFRRVGPERLRHDRPGSVGSSGERLRRWCTTPCTPAPTTAPRTGRHGSMAVRDGIGEDTTRLPRRSFRRSAAVGPLSPKLNPRRRTRNTATMSAEAPRYRLRTATRYAPGQVGIPVERTAI